MIDRVTVSLSEDLVEEINGKLEYGDSRSEWIREAICSAVITILLVILLLKRRLADYTIRHLPCVARRVVADVGTTMISGERQ